MDNNNNRTAKCFPTVAPVAHQSLLGAALFHGPDIKDFKDFRGPAL